jgi:hypothetical protein
MRSVFFHGHLPDAATGMLGNAAAAPGGML